MVGFAVEEDDAAREVVALRLHVDAEVVQTLVYVLDAVNDADVDTVSMQYVGVDSKWHFVYPADSTVRLTR